MRALGLDMSTRTGIGVVDSGNTVIHGEEVYFSKERRWPRVQSIVARVMESVQHYKPDIIVIEDLFIGHASSAIVLAEIHCVLRYFLWQEDIPHITVPATSLKKWLTGTGKAQKDSMMMEVYKQTGYTPETNNVADAVALGMYGLAYLGQPAKLSQQVKTILQSTANNT